MQTFTQSQIALHTKALAILTQREVLLEMLNRKEETDDLDYLKAALERVSNNYVDILIEITEKAVPNVRTLTPEETAEILQAIKN